MLKRAKFLAALAVLFLGAMPALAAGLDARLSARQVAEGDQVVLQLSADLGSGVGQPDLSVLEKDFTVLGTSSGTQTTIVNGRRSDRRTWQVTLVPNHAGKITIPPISAGSVSSQPLELTVLDAASLPPELRASRPKVTVSVGADTVYAQQEVPVIVSVRLPAGTRSARIEAPQGNDVLLEQAGEDQTTRQPDGTILLERRYFLRPQKEGRLELGPFRAVAEVVDPNASASPFGASPFGRDPFEDFFRNSPFGQNPFGQNPFGNSPFASPFGRDPFGSLFEQTRRVSAASDPVTLEVKPTPGGASGWALPAKSVELREIWQPDPPKFKVGEAVTRKVQVVALGAHGEQIPDIEMPDLPNAQVYFEGSEIRSIPTEKGTTAVREFTWSIVPTSGGELVLPGLTVDWFDTTREEAAQARLPQRSYHVEGPVTAKPAKPAGAGAGAAAHDGAGSNALTGNAGTERYLTLALFAGAVVALLAFGYLGLRWLIVLFARRRKNDKAMPAKSAAAPSGMPNRRREALARLSKAARARDAAAAHRATMDWIRAAGLSVDAARVRFADLAAALDAVEAELFAPEGTKAARADLAALEAAVRAADARLEPQRGGDQALPPLYPTAA